ncbi:MAG: nuclear transport factor 2 family protein [Pseudomonadota bacterium]
MSIEQLANDFTAAVKADDIKAYQSFWSDNIVSLEPGDSPMARVEGREALLKKHAWWMANTQVHSTTTEGPYVFGDQFAVRYGMDVTMDGERSQMEEVGIYTVADGKIAEERFFYGTGA